MTADYIYTVAGNGTAGLSGNGGKATSAELSSPVWVSLDSSGNLAVADQGNNEIRYVANSGGTHFGQSMTAGYIYDLAGNGTSGYTNGVLATSAELSSPGSVAFDPSGDLVIGDSGNNYVRFVPASSGTYYGQSMTANYIYTIAGVSWCGDGGNGGPASSAWVCYPVVAVDSAGDLLIADTWINDVRIVAASSGTLAGQSVTAGDIYQIAGNSDATYSGNGVPAAQAELNDPNAVRVDAAGDVIITDYENHAVRFVPASSGTFFGQSMVAGDIYTIAGTGSAGYSGDGAPATSAHLNGPHGAATGATANLAIADSGNNVIRFVPSASGTYFGRAMTADDIYTVAGNGTEGYTGNGGPGTSAELNGPSSVAIDSAGGIVIADCWNEVVRYLAPANGTYYGQAMTAGDIYTIAGNGSTGYTGNGGPATSAEFNGLYNVFLDSAGDLLLADSNNNVVRFVPLTTGAYYGQSMTADDIYTIAGNGTYGYSGNAGPATSAEFANLNDVTVDSAGDLYITDSNNEYIRYVPVTTGTYYGQAMTADDVYNIAGTGWNPENFTGDGGPATAATLTWPTSAAPDPQGGFYIADFSGERIRHVSAPVSATQVWNDASVPSGLGPLYGISCATATNCVAVGVTTNGKGEVVETTNRGASWSSDTVPSSAPPLLSVSCWAAGACVAVGGGLSPNTGGIYRQTSVGGAFSAVTEPSGHGELDAVSCPSSSYCAALAYDTTAKQFDDVLKSTNAGASWSVAESTMTVSSQWVSLSSIDCLTATTCVASGSGYYAPSVVATSNAWSSYSGAYYGSAPAYLEALSCASTSYCLAAGLADTLSGPATGGSWTESQDPPPISQILGDLCISTTTCGLVGDTTLATSPVNGPGAIEMTSNAGSTWTQEAAAPGTGTLFGLSCAPNGGPCLSVGESYAIGAAGNGIVLTDGGDVLNTSAPVTVTGSAYTADATGGGSPSEVTLDQNVQFANGPEAVDTANGDVSYSLTDLSVPGPGIPLQFIRTYDALTAQSEEAGTTLPPLGYGWTDNLGMSLSYNSSSKVATITEETGDQISFVPSAGDGNSWCAGLGTSYFCPSSPRVEAMLENDNTTGGYGPWTFTRYTGGDYTYSFTATGTLSQITDPAGDSLVEGTYSGNNPACPGVDTCTAWTSYAGSVFATPVGQLVLATNSANELAEVFVPEATDQVVSYFYSGTGCSLPKAELCAVTDTLGNTTSFSYDTGNANAALKYDVLTITPPGNIGSYTNTYNGSGQVVSESDPVGSDTTTFTYGTGSGGLATTTVATGGSSAAPQESEYDYSNNVLTNETTGVGSTTPGMEKTARSSSVLLDTSTTDPDGNTTANTYSTSGAMSAADVVLSSDGSGNTTQDLYNTDNQVWCSVDAADYLNGTRCPNISPPTTIPPHAIRARRSTPTTAPTSSSEPLILSATPPPTPTPRESRTSRTASCTARSTRRTTRPASPVPPTGPPSPVPRPRPSTARAT